MKLSAIKQYLMKARMSSLSNLCQLFEMDTKMMRCLLQHLVTTGKVRQCYKKSACGTKCVQCPSEQVEIYEWVDVAMTKGI